MDHRGGDKNKQIPRLVDGGTFAEHRADTGQVTENRNRLDNSALLALEHTAHHDALAGTDHHSRGKFLRSPLGQENLELVLLAFRSFIEGLTLE